MKKISVLLSMVVFTLALGAAFATSSQKMLVTEVWRKPTAGGLCAPTICTINGTQPCDQDGFVYFDNSVCSGLEISPMKD
jgi:hypothetical protein